MVLLGIEVSPLLGCQFIWIQQQKYGTRWIDLKSVRKHLESGFRRKLWTHISEGDPDLDPGWERPCWKGWLHKPTAPVSDLQNLMFSNGGKSLRLFLWSWEMLCLKRRWRCSGPTCPEEFTSYGLPGCCCVESTGVNFEDVVCSCVEPTSEYHQWMNAGAQCGSVNVPSNHVNRIQSIIALLYAPFHMKGSVWVAWGSPGGKHNLILINYVVVGMPVLAGVHLSAHIIFV